MKATAKNFFGTNLEQEVLDEVLILPVAIRNVGTGTITLPINMRWTDFEYLEIAIGISTNATAYTPHVVSGKYIASAPDSWTSRVQFNDGSLYGLSVFATGESTANWGSFGSGANNYPLYMIGYKRRISRVGIDELMSAMSLPNLIANADLTDNPVNQRGFNGNWSSLAVGAYGYDQWMKVSSTHMGYVVEAGKYRPSTKHTLTKDDVVLGEFMSPASGHWVVSVPFATSGKFDLYAGQFKRPWHPVQYGTELCKRYFYIESGVDVKGTALAVNDINSTFRQVFVRFPSTMRKTPEHSFTLTEAVSTVSVSKSNQSCAVVYKVGQAGNWGGYTLAMFDASITLAEVGGQITTVG